MFVRGGEGWVGVCMGVCVHVLMYVCVFVFACAVCVECCVCERFINYLFIYLLKAYSPVSRTGSPLGYGM